MPHAIRRVPPNPTTDYRGGWVSTVTPLNTVKADAIVATQLFEATKWAALFEGMGLEFVGGGSQWRPTAATVEGFNPFDFSGKKNGSACSLTWRWRCDGRDATATLKRLQIPVECLTVGADEVFLPGRLHRIEVRDGPGSPDGPSTELTYWNSTSPYFYRWASRQKITDESLGTVRDVYRFNARAVGTDQIGYAHPFRLVWRLRDADILERTWYFTLGQGHRHPTDALAIGTRSAHGTIVTSPHTGDYHCADDGKVTPLDATTVRDCDSAFDDRHDSTVAI
ncbi:hypothetical protein [Gordonia soli]|uniref:Uncharacterized protein n=1 Tax=Gordonia soli NBRC 108243 TaxID=1223545 RepID=M0QM02_9ACTN|nr:hypothetical protein [Gordonia soli]GAC69326.1 hypothetical protein GS4_23_01230 [Gordonia soli NBRC 108243]